MAFLTKKIASSKKWPNWLKAGITKSKSIKKAFPSIGLKNCSGKTDTSIVDDMVISHLDAAICDGNDDDLLFETKAEVLAAEALYIANSILKNGSLVMKSDLVSPWGKILCKKGESASKLLAKKAPHLKRITYRHSKSICDEIVRLCGSKSKLKIVFSYDPWDIATMSMRGISSCQSWNSHYKECVIGSVVDPYAAVIYITDGSKTQYGERMLARSVVRIVVPSKEQKDIQYWKTHRKTRATSIFIEEPYIASEDDSETNADYVRVFADFITSKLGNKVKIVSGYDSHRYQIPMSDAVKKINVSQRSYIDSGLSYEDGQSSS
jgi:hypothetical protein